MGDRSAEVLKLTIILVACIAFMSVAFVIFSITKAQANEESNNLIFQIDAINNMDFTALDNEVVSGSMVKQTINDMKGKDVAFIVVTNSLLGTQLSEIGLRDEATCSGNLSEEMFLGRVPFVALENFTLDTLQGTVLNNPIAINYGSVLKNSASDIADDGLHIKSILSDDGFDYALYDETKEFGQTLYYEDGYFHTKLDFATDTSSKIIRYDMQGDFNRKGTTMFINDASVYLSYLLKNVYGEIVGVVFVQR